MAVERPRSFFVINATTADGEVLTINVPEDLDTEAIKDTISRLHKVHVPVNHAVDMPHGGYGAYSRYELEQHRYAGGSHGFIEVLEVKDSPDGRKGIVIHEYNQEDGHAFSEFDTPENAAIAFETSGLRPDWAKIRIPQAQGFQRRVECGPLTPWFYAVGNEELAGDFTVPRGLCDDPVYRLGKKCKVYDGENNWKEKVCLGTRFVETTDGYSGRTVTQRVVYFDDGTNLEGRCSFCLNKTSPASLSFPLTLQSKRA